MLYPPALLLLQHEPAFTEETIEKLDNMLSMFDIDEDGFTPNEKADMIIFLDVTFHRHHGHAMGPDLYSNILKAINMMTDEPSAEEAVYNLPDILHHNPASFYAQTSSYRRFVMLNYFINHETYMEWAPSTRVNFMNAMMLFRDIITANPPMASSFFYENSMCKSIIKVYGDVISTVLIEDGVNNSTRSAFMYDVSNAIGVDGEVYPAFVNDEFEPKLITPNLADIIDGFGLHDDGEDEDDDYEEESLPSPPSFDAVQFTSDNLRKCMTTLAMCVHRRCGVKVLARVNDVMYGEVKRYVESGVLRRYTSVRPFDYTNDTHIAVGLDRDQMMCYGSGGPYYDPRPINWIQDLVH